MKCRALILGLLVTPVLSISTYMAGQFEMDHIVRYLNQRAWAGA